MASTPMPPDYAHWVAHILCNDCNQVHACRDSGPPITLVPPLGSLDDVWAAKGRSSRRFIMPTHQLVYVILTCM